MMLVWARAAIFAHLNNLPLVTSPWWGIRWGAWKRNERKKRIYWGYFRESSWIEKWGIWNSRLFCVTVKNPSVNNLERRKLRKKLFVFDKVILQNDLFASIREHQLFLENEIYNLLNPALRQQIKKYEVPQIAVHIRRGDFKHGNPITPQAFFIACIRHIRVAVNNQLPVTVFTDAEANEISEVLALPDVKLADPKADILDLLLMSKARFLVLSRSSTFSYWAAFLSNAIVVRPHNDWQPLIKDSKNNYREINWNCNEEKAGENLVKKIMHLWETTQSPVAGTN